MVEDTPAIVERVLGILREEGRPLRGDVLARRALHLAGRVPALAVSILERALGADPRLSRDGAGLWMLRALPDTAPATVEAAVWVHLTGSRPPLDRPLAIGLRTRDGIVSETRCDPGGTVRAERLLALGLRAADLAGAPDAPSARAAARRELAGRATVVWDAVQARALAPDVEPRLVLAPVLVRAGAARRGGSIVDAAAELGVPWDGEVGAGALAGLLLHLHDAAEAEGALDAQIAAERPDAHVPSWVLDLPEGPGVYRFVSDAGAVLYVGKARSLRARVRTYFGPADRRRRHPDLMARTAGVRVVETASELEALLLEAETIREESPPYNVQRTTGRRAGRLGDAVLFFPGVGGEVLALLLAAGLVVARVAIGPRRRGVGRLDAAIRRFVFGGDVAPEDRGAGEILKTWLRRSGDEVSLLDLAAVTSATAASRLVRAYLADPELLRGPVLHRD